MQQDIEVPVFTEAIVLGREDYVRLAGLLIAPGSVMPPEVRSSFLRALDNAVIVDAAHLPDHVVRIGSSLIVRDCATGEERSCVLGWFDRGDSPDRISVLTPLGSAMIGAPAQAVVSCKSSSGDVRTFKILDVDNSGAMPCRPCGPMPQPAPAVSRGFLEDQRMEVVMCVDGVNGKDIPAVVMTDRDWMRLRRLVNRAATLYHPVSDLLAQEIERATVCPVDEIPEDVITMNSRVVFRTQGGTGPESRFLVFPERYAPNGYCVSVTSPLGAALIGLRSGSSFHYRSRDGEVRKVFVQEVAYQPEAAARKRVPPDLPGMASDLALPGQGVR